MQLNRFFLGVIAALALAATSARATNYVAEGLWSGTFWHPSYPGYGYNIEVQNGLLFGLVYLYHDDGQPAFLSFQSAKSSDGRNFSGNVYLTDRVSGTVEAGSFSATVTSYDSDPAWILSIDSDLLSFNSRTLRRFRFNEADALSKLAGSNYGFVIWDSQPTYSSKFTNLMEPVVFFDIERLVDSDGDPMIEGATWDNLEYVFAEDDSELGLLVYHFDEYWSDEAVAYMLIANGQAAYGLAYLFENGEITVETPVGGALFVRDSSSKAMPAPRQLDSKAKRALHERAAQMRAALLKRDSVKAELARRAAQGR